MKLSVNSFPLLHADLSLKNPEDDEVIATLCRALSSPLRIKILRQIRERPQSVIELAKNNFVALSTMVFHVDILANAALINIEYIKGSRGPVRYCYTNLHKLSYNFWFDKETKHSQEIVYTMGVGQFIDASNNPGECNFATADKNYHSSWENLFSRERFNAELIYFQKGFVTYAFPNDFATRHTCKEVSISLEICSEVYYHDNNWKSDITFWINDVELLTYTCPGDFGDRRGILTPDWWVDNLTQYGELKTVTVNTRGVYLNKQLITNKITIDDLKLSQSNRMHFKLGNKPTAVNVGGFNIFGKKFGDHEQDIVLTATVIN